MNHFDVRSLILGAVFLALAFSLGIFSPVFWPGSSTSHAQSSQDGKFWVFDGHMHPTSSAYRRGGDIGEPGPDPRFTLSMAQEGGLGAAFFNTSIDEFFEANHLSVKEALRQFDHFYRQIAMFPDQVGVARNAADVRALRQERKVAAIMAIEGREPLMQRFGELQ